jgi:large subunit ribosomal protein L4
MAKVTVYSLDKSKVGEIEIPDAILNEPVRKDLLHTTVRWQLASRRQGTHATKTRGLVSGGGKKPFKQKGTGNARQGSSRSPLMPGGGTAFGPQPRGYDYVLPKKVKQKALRVALAYLHKEGRLFVVDSMESKNAKTKELAKQLKAFGLPKAVLVDGAENQSFQRASRNLANFRYYKAEALNVYDLLKYDHLLLTKASVQEISRKCGLES